MKVIFWGAGRRAVNFLNKIKTDEENVYVAIVDRDTERRGQSLNGLKIIAPYELPDQNYDMIVITTSIYEAEIRRQLRLDLNISIAEERVVSLEDYERICFTEKVYRNRYGSGADFKSTGRFDTRKIVVYTAIIGKYDTLKPPLFQSEEIDYICFTNNPELQSNIWEVRQIEKQGMDDVHLARHLKLNPHLYFPEYETSVWVDGQIQIKNDIRTYIAQYQKNEPMLCFPHCERLCIGDEAAMCTIAHKGNKKDMFFQVADYWKDGYPMDYGLYETGCLVRAHNDFVVKELMQAWEGEIRKYSIRDQLSFPYVCWKNNFVPDICNLYINKNPWLWVYPHLAPGMSA